MSSFINYSIYGYEVNAIRYVLKDDNFKLNLYACLEIIIKERIKMLSLPRSSLLRSEKVPEVRKESASGMLTARRFPSA